MDSEARVFPAEHVVGELLRDDIVFDQELEQHMAEDRFDDAKLPGEAWLEPNGLGIRVIHEAVGSDHMEVRMKIHFVSKGLNNDDHAGSLLWNDLAVGKRQA